MGRGFYVDERHHGDYSPQMGEIDKVTSESPWSMGSANMTKRARKQGYRDSANWPIAPVLDIRCEPGGTTREIPADAASLSPLKVGWSHICLSLSFKERQTCVPRSLACV